MNEDVVVIASIVVIGLLLSSATGIINVFSKSDIPADSIYSGVPRGSPLSPPPPPRSARPYTPINPVKKTFRNTFNPNTLFYDEDAERGALTIIGGKKRKTKRT
jgi:hypothetical protein